MSLGSRGDAALIRRQKQAWGRTITYARKVGATTTEYEFTAWPAKTLFAREGTELNGATVIHGEADYLFSVADAAEAGLTLPPKRGDRITDPNVLDDRTGDPKTFELQTPTGEPEWRYEQGQTIVRVHCQRAGRT